MRVGTAGCRVGSWKQTGGQAAHQLDEDVKVWTESCRVGSWAQKGVCCMLSCIGSAEGE